MEKVKKKIEKKNKDRKSCKRKIKELKNYFFQVYMMQLSNIGWIFFK